MSTFSEATLCDISHTNSYLAIRETRAIRSLLDCCAFYAIDKQSIIAAICAYTIEHDLLVMFSETATGGNWDCTVDILPLRACAFRVEVNFEQDGTAVGEIFEFSYYGMRAILSRGAQFETAFDNDLLDDDSDYNHSNDELMAELIFAALHHIVKKAAK